MNRAMRRSQRFRIALLGGPDFATRMTCAEAGCQAAAQGWTLVLDPADTKHAAAARWIKGDSGRRYIELGSDRALEYLVNNQDSLGMRVTTELRGLLERTPAGMLVYIFPPGQQCFRVHQDREVVFAHQQGEIQRLHSKPLEFNEHFNEEADRVNTALQRG